MFLLYNVPHLTKGWSQGQLFLIVCMDARESGEGQGESLAMKGCLTDFSGIQ